MPMLPPLIKQTPPLMCTMIGTSASIEPITDFDKDISISLGDYYYSKFDKEVVKRRKRRTKDQSGMDVFSLIKYSRVKSPVTHR